MMDTDQKVRDINVGSIVQVNDKAGEWRVIAIKGSFVMLEAIHESWVKWLGTDLKSVCLDQCDV